MRQYAKSVGYALAGIRHAFRTERNFRLFLLGYTVSLAAALLLQIDLDDFPVILLSGGVFLAIELINTALEHIADAFDTHSKKQDDLHFKAIKCTKDIAAGAALVSAIVWAFTLFIIFWPYILVKMRLVLGL